MTRVWKSKNLLLRTKKSYKISRRLRLKHCFQLKSISSGGEILMWKRRNSANFKTKHTEALKPINSNVLLH